jgi:hypothetical protein
MNLYKYSLLIYLPLFFFCCKGSGQNVYNGDFERYTCASDGGSNCPNYEFFTNGCVPNWKTVTGTIVYSRSGSCNSQRILNGYGSALFVTNSASLKCNYTFYANRAYPIKFTYFVNSNGTSYKLEAVSSSTGARQMIYQDNNLTKTTGNVVVQSGFTPTEAYDEIHISAITSNNYGFAFDDLMIDVPCCPVYKIYRNQSEVPDKTSVMDYIKIGGLEGREIQINKNIVLKANNFIELEDGVHFDPGFENYQDVVIGDCYAGDNVNLGLRVNFLNASNLIAYPYGGSGVYEYKWTNGSTTQTSNGFSNNCSLFVTVTDKVCYATVKDNYYECLNRTDENELTAEATEADSETKGSSLLVQIFPNPVKDIAMIYSSSDLEFMVYDNLGKFIMDGKLKSGESFVDFNKLEEGIYLIVISDGINSTYKKISIVH